MGIATYSFGFYSNLNGFVEKALSSKISVAHQSGTGVAAPVDGCMRFQRLTGGTGTETEKAWYDNTTTLTWEDLGVPAGKFVTCVRLSTYYTHVAALHANTTLNLWSRIVYGDGVNLGNALHADDKLFNYNIEPPALPPFGWSASNSSPLKMVNLDAQPSNTPVQLEIGIDLTTTDLVSCNCDVRIDGLVFEMTYEDGSVLTLTGDGSCDGTVNLSWA